MTNKFKEIGLACSLFPKYQHLQYEAPIFIGDNSSFNGQCAIGAFSYINGDSQLNQTTIGRYCSIAANVFFGPGQHSTDTFSTHPFTFDPSFTTGLGEFEAYQKIVNSKPNNESNSLGTRRKLSNRITIGNDVWIGQQVTIMNGVNIGDGCIIGTGAIVTKDLEPYSVVGGVPAKLIRKRFSESIIERFLKLKWWNYDLADVKDKVDYGRIEETLDFFETAIAQNKLNNFKPQKFLLKNEQGNFTVDLV